MERKFEWLFGPEEEDVPEGAVRGLTEDGIEKWAIYFKHKERNESDMEINEEIEKFKANGYKWLNIPSPTPEHIKAVNFVMGKSSYCWK